MPTRSPTPTAQFAKFISRFPPGINAMVKRVIPKLRKALPGSYELVYNYAKSVVVSFSQSERGYEAPVALAIFPHEVRLYFDKTLPDPKGLLKGAGTKVRSLVLESANDLDTLAIKALLKAAAKRSGVSTPLTAAKRMIIK